ncbi:MAG: formylglycine-generating enzyme family protein [Prevotellaceae bacterium]|jgi:gliding motility-associated lipoprotein GldJ|nr:formylglycine-generating enzyme family protein [Prevotellaceae bacterium]
MRSKFVVCICLSAVLSGCFWKKEVSEKTGWKYNDAKYGGVERVKPNKEKIAPGLIFINGGAFIMGQIADDIGNEWDNLSRRATVDSYYMDETEVTNQHYRDYIFWLSSVLTGFPNVVKNALPDTLVWRRPLAYNEPYVQTYFRYPSYNDYPVVGVTWLQANEYCLWRTNRVNEAELIKRGIIKSNIADQLNENNFDSDAFIAGQYEAEMNERRQPKNIVTGDARPIKYEDGILFPKYRLPTEAEFEYAARAEIGVTTDERTVERRVYGWNGANVRDPSKKRRGMMMANFQRGRGDLAGVAGGRQNDGAAIPEAVRSYPPNDFGLYDMIGNVNEWVADIYRPMSFNDVEEFNPFRGNVFMDLSRDDEGQILPKDSLGRMRYDTVGFVNRYNYRVGDNRNYKDGDIGSSIFYGEAGEQEKPDTVANSNRVYFQGTGEQQNNMATLITDKSRVYKGGGFLDRPYWLRPATRRFLDQDKAQWDIGFRCAMSSLGGETKILGNKRNKKK